MDSSKKWLLAAALLCAGMLPASPGITAGTNVHERTVHFPKDFSLGRLQIRDRGSQRWQDWRDWVPARGYVLVPAGKELRLSIYEAFEHRSYLSSLGPDDIQELYLSSPDLADADLVHIKGLSGLESLFLGGTYAGPCPLMGQGLVNLQRMTKLRSLMLDFTSITDDHLAHLKSLNALETLSLHRNKQLNGEGLVHLKNLSALRELRFYVTPIQDFALEHIKHIKSLEELSLQSTQVTDEGLVHLQGLPRLKKLILPGQIGDEGLTHIRGLTSLQELLVYGEDITDVGLAHLKDLPSLKTLGLLSAKITGDAVERLRKDRPGLEISISLSLDDDTEMAQVKGLPCVTSLQLSRSKVTNAGLAYVDGLTSLRYLGLTRTAVTDAGLAHVQGLHALTNLDLDDTQIGDEGIAHIKNLTALNTLRLRNTYVSDAALAYLAGMKSLEMLFLDGTQISDAGLVHLKDLKSLVVLFLGRTNISGPGLAHLKGLTSLNHLDLPGTPLTDAAVEHLKEMTWLHILSINPAGMSDKAVEELRQALPDCSLRMQKEQFVPRPRPAKFHLDKAPSLVGKALPPLGQLNLALDPAQAEVRPILLCFFDMNQRPSRSCIGQLSERAEQLRQTGVIVAAVQAEQVEQGTLAEWAKKSKIAFDVGRITGDIEKTRLAWGVKSLPWLILTDTRHVVAAEGFGLDELDEKIDSINRKR
jgi:Leucine-rich repeat (LRR) protein